MYNDGATFQKNNNMSLSVYVNNKNLKTLWAHVSITMPQDGILAVFSTLNRTALFTYSGISKNYYIVVFFLNYVYGYVLKTTDLKAEYLTQKLKKNTK